MLDRHQIASASQTLHDHWRAGTKLDTLDAWLKPQDRLAIRQRVTQGRV